MPDQSTDQSQNHACVESRDPPAMPSSQLSDLNENSIKQFPGSKIAEAQLSELYKEKQDGGGAVSGGGGAAIDRRLTYAPAESANQGKE